MSKKIRVTISETEYRELKKSKRFIENLVMNGVNNWEWYEDSINTFEESEMQNHPEDVDIDF